jgi:hypothetical protein
MAYLSDAQQLDGLFDWVAKTAGVAAGKAYAKGEIPILSQIFKPPGILPLTVSKPSMPPLYDAPKALPPNPKPLPMLPASPMSVPQPIQNQVQGIMQLVNSALHAVRTSERPLATSIGTNLAPSKPAPSPTATRVPGAPSGSVPSSPPVDVETRTIVNGAGNAVIPYVPPPSMPPWVIPVAIAGGGLLLFMAMRRR